MDYLLGRTSTSLQLSQQPFNNICQLKSTEHLYGKSPEMRIQKSALCVISTNELAFVAMENARLRLSFAFCCPMNIFI